MARDIAVMFDELKAMADRHAELHADRARLEAELDRARQNASLWREEADRDRARVAGSVRSRTKTSKNHNRWGLLLRFDLLCLGTWRET
jgi:septal ring factor EnvC (AmiA/AmiB activator)